MIYKLISVRTVISKVISDLAIAEDDIKISDFREWASEAVEKIGAITQLERKVSGIEDTPITILKGYQAQLPCNLHKLHQVAYSYCSNGPWFPMRKATGSFSVWGCNSDCNCNDPNILIQDDVMVNLVVSMYGDIDKTKALELLNTNQNLKTIVSNLINCHTVGDDFFINDSCPSTDLQYNIKPGYIMTNVPCGYLKLAYSIIPTDEEGYALIPDHASYLEAIYWYITMKYKYPEYLNGRMNREIYYDIRRSWNFYCKQAYAEALLPNEDEMESIKNSWNKLVPELNDHSTFYSHTGERQIIYNNN